MVIDASSNSQSMSDDDKSLDMARLPSETSSVSHEHGSGCSCPSTDCTHSYNTSSEEDEHKTDDKEHIDDTVGWALRSENAIFQLTHAAFSPVSTASSASAVVSVALPPTPVIGDEVIESILLQVRSLMVVRHERDFAGHIVEWLAAAGHPVAPEHGRCVRVDLERGEGCRPWLCDRVFMCSCVNVSVPVVSASFTNHMSVLTCLSAR